MSSATQERQYEGYERHSDGTVISAQCEEGRHSECYDTTSDDDTGPMGGPLEGYYCECPGCVHGDD